MTRRTLFGSLLLGPASGLYAWRSEMKPGFPGAPFRDYSKCLPSYLSTLASAAMERRDAALRKLTSPGAIQLRQQQVREILWKLIGGMPERTPLNPRITGSFERSGYRVDKLIYESRPNLFVSANLYVPTTGPGPFPAVLFQSGHYWEAKAYPSYQRCCQGLARLGFVVLAFDPMGQGERINYLNEAGDASLLADCDSEHTTPGKQLLLYGDSTARFQLWDAIRSLDHLLSLPMVDTKRVASVGHSGGGTLTMLLAAADDRLAAAAVCMGNIENLISAPFRSPGAMDDAEQDFVNAGVEGFDRWDLMYPIAPKPLLVWPSDRDFYATYSPDYVRNGWEEFQKLRSVYATLGKREHVAWADTPLPHALAYDSRMLAYNWFRRWLQNEKQPLASEPETNPEPITTLWATERGSVVRSLKSDTPFMINRSRVVTRTPERMEKLLNVDLSKVNGVSKVVGHVQSRNVLVQNLEIPSDPSVWLPAFLMTPDKVSSNRPVLVVLDAAGNDRLWFAPEVDRILPKDSGVVCSADVRGTGSLRPGFSAGAAEYELWHEQEENYAWSSLILGHPLVGQRVTDIVAVVRAVSKLGVAVGRPIYLAASSKLTVPAIFAASVEPLIQSLYLNGGLVSFQSVAETEMYHHPFADFVPGLLNHMDLPDLVAGLAPRKVVLTGTVDAGGYAMKAETVSEVYRAAQRGGNLSVQAGDEWSVKTLMSYVGG